ncbi:helicase-related protein [Companilactobacillus sp. DQM5]|uniref:helicase-related protein n=1 Tax=Companilactobacillus sp. DQM5 TaxID=3463359 RepID=UPI004057F667
MNDFNIQSLSNRVLVLNELSEKYLSLTTKYDIIPAIENNKCNRCLGSDFGYINEKKYCRSCVGFGRIDENTKLIKFRDLLDLKEKDNYLKWNGKLSDLQNDISNQLCKNIYKFKSHLLWAVTGAGKTEILYATLNNLFIDKNKVALVSPRIDVCEELFPRITQAFDISAKLMHGKKEEEYIPAQLIIATVHQLIKFERSFDVIIVDEVDSYPLFGNQWLQNIILKALKNNGKIIYLSATPPKEILKNVEKTYYLCQRFHGKPLPVPKSKMLFFEKQILKHLNTLYKNNQRFLLFFPSIKVMNEFIERNSFNFFFKAVSSKNKKRIEIIKEFRENKIFALFTTTILERGVTFKNVEIIVYNSDNKNFSKETLIQIAGRAGRKKEYFDDNVTFYYFLFNKQVKESVLEIKKLNRLAKNL